MKKLILFIALLATSQWTFAQTMSKAEKKQAAAKVEIEASERQRFAAQVSKNFDFLGKVFADDLIYTHSGGKIDSKETYINSIKEGKSAYDKIEVEEMRIRPYNDQKAAVVNGTVMITQPPVDGKPVMLHIRYAVVYVKTKAKGWQLVMWQSLKLPS
jgi:ABC-type Fe3+/spermidine/putrescine transport system ATPase subunit